MTLLGPRDDVLHTWENVHEFWMCKDLNIDSRESLTPAEYGTLL
jgi:hypothetical protein